MIFWIFCKIITPKQIAKVCHEANRAYCQGLGDDSQPSWEEAPEWQRASALHGVTFHLINPGAAPSRSHEEWLEEKRKEGWKHGPIKDPIKKEHPCFLPYDQLPVAQQNKDRLFIGIVDALRNLVEVVTRQYP